ncbi:hypothetical protein ACIQ1D_18020 [Lysinibacillus xylanilyticus]|uniref:hypothetical protein n=1 Tax=Lysinibacillus xylanilyticus TaxID=582475 RepID=UPI0038046AB5
MKRKYKKLIARSGLIVLLMSLAGGGVYLANQKSLPDTQEQVDEITKENTAETYIQNVYTTYLDEIVPTWNDLSNGNSVNVQEIQNKIPEWKSQLSNQEVVYEALKTPITLQISALEEFLALSQENVSSEQRKRLRELSAEFINGHDSVKEGLLQILEEQGAKYTVTDGGIEYQFKND